MKLARWYSSTRWWDTFLSKALPATMNATSRYPASMASAARRMAHTAPAPPQSPFSTQSSSRPNCSAT